MKNPIGRIVQIVFVALLCTSSPLFCATVEEKKVPAYIERGLHEYQVNGYEAAVEVWLANSPYQNATTLASSNAFFKNIEKLAGRYRSYDILMIKETISSNAVYVRMNYERLPGYILFTSIKRDEEWVLGRIRLERKQSFGSL